MLYFFQAISDLDCGISFRHSTLRLIDGEEKLTDLTECRGGMEFKANPCFVGGDFCIPFLHFLDVETGSNEKIYYNQDDLMIGI